MALEKGQVESPSSTQPGPTARPPITPEHRKQLQASLVIARLARANKRLRKQAKLARLLPKQVEVAEPTRDREVYRAPKARTAPPKPLMVTVTLQMRHSINGLFTGPGTVTLPEAKARAFLNIEHEALAKEDTLVRQQAFIVSFRNGVPVRREVPASRFDEILGREELPISTFGGQP